MPGRHKFSFSGSEAVICEYCGETKTDLHARKVAGQIPLCEGADDSLTVGFIPLPSISEIFVRDIPDALLPEEEDKSCHASTMFEDPMVIEWFQTNLVLPLEWEFEHPYDVPQHASNRFISYEAAFLRLGYKIWKIENKQHATSYLKVVSSHDDNKYIVIAGKSDYLITKRDVTVRDYLNKPLCVIEVQSKPQVSLCELQMQVYVLILMNTKGLSALAGFLILDNGQCRAYKASRDAMGDCLFEMNSLFHVCHLPEVMDRVIRELGLID